MTEYLKILTTLLKTTLPDNKTCLGMTQGTWRGAQGIDPIPKFTRSQPDKNLWDVQEQVWSIGGATTPTHRIHCQCPNARRHSPPRSLVSLPRCVRAVLATQGEPALYKAGDRSKWMRRSSVPLLTTTFDVGWHIVTFQRYRRDGLIPN